MSVNVKKNVNMSGNSVNNMSSLDGFANKVVYDTADLESAFNNVSAGDTIVICQPATPYRPDQWLDIDVDDVTVVARSRFAEDGSAIIMPADGADVGGFRVGHNSHTENVTIQNVGFDGNQSTMTAAVKRLHGFILEDTQDCVLQNNYATNLHPYQEHGTGGSGITVREASTEARVVGNLVKDAGDRSIQVAGNRHIISRNKCTLGFDRGISLDVNQPDGTHYEAQNTIVAHNVIKNMSDGSCISGKALGEDTVSPLYNNIAIGNVGYGYYKGLVQWSGGENCVAIGNTGYHQAGGNVDATAIEMMGDHICIGNQIYDPDDAHTSMGIVDGACKIAYNVFQGGGNDKGVQVNGGSSSIENNYFLDISDAIDFNGTGRVYIVIKGNRIQDWSGIAINIEGGHDNVVDNNFGNPVGTTPTTWIRNNATEVAIRDNWLANATNVTNNYDLVSTPALITDNYPVS